MATAKNIESNPLPETLSPIDELIGSVPADSRSITPNMIAAAIGCDPKQLRAMIRRMTSNRAGRGGAWAFTPEEAQRFANGWAAKRSIRATAPTFKD